ncbi:hypothetical protein BX667DRAFT_505699 [Coemansia mojavensis]|nr:hypothetical protein BX667DRAFT_505699 [Coemansia mojavensis]
MFPFYMLLDLMEQLASLPIVKDHLASPEHLEMSSGQAGALPTAGPNPVVAAEPAGAPLSALHSALPQLLCCHCGFTLFILLVFLVPTCEVSQTTQSNKVGIKEANSGHLKLEI